MPKGSFVHRHRASGIFYILAQIRITPTASRQSPPGPVVDMDDLRRSIIAGPRQVFPIWAPGPLEKPPTLTPRIACSQRPGVHRVTWGRHPSESAMADSRARAHPCNPVHSRITPGTPVPGRKAQPGQSSRRMRTAEPRSTRGGGSLSSFEPATVTLASFIRP